MLIQVGNVAACKASEQTAQGSALGFNPSKKERPASYDFIQTYLVNIL